jgi:hypothetical protein
MTLQEFIEKLQALGRPELPVCLADWNESYMELWEGPAEAVEIVTGEYRNWPGGEMTHGEFVRIGKDW